MLHVICSSCVATSYFIASLYNLDMFHSFGQAVWSSIQSQVSRTKICLCVGFITHPTKMAPRFVPPWNDMCHLSLILSCSFTAKNQPKQPQAATGLPEINDPNGPNPIQTSGRDSWSGNWQKNSSEVDEPMNFLGLKIVDQLCGPFANILNNVPITSNYTDAPNHPA